MSNPVAHGGSLYALMADHPRPPTLLRAVRAVDGSQLWESPGPITGFITTDGSMICAIEIQGASQPGRLWAWRASDGQRLWVSPRHQSFGLPAGAGRGDLRGARRRDDGRLPPGGPREAVEPPGRRPDPEWAGGSVVYAGDPSGGLLALRAADGQFLWKSGSRFTAGPFVAAGSVLRQRRLVRVRNLA